MQIRKIESRDNSKLKLARKVREGREHQYIFVEGLRLAEEALSSAVAVLFGIFRQDFGENPRETALANQLSRAGVGMLRVDERVFSTIADTKTSQGIALICSRPNASRSSFEQAIEKVDAALPIVLFLFEINNPSNLGAVIRTAAAAGILGVITSENSADVFSPKALRASMGALFRVPIWANGAADEVLRWSAGKGNIIAAGSGNGTIRHTSVDWTRQRLLIMGSEAHGVSQGLLDQAKEKIRIDMEPGVESLNIAVAAGVILFEARRHLIS